MSKYKEFISYESTETEEGEVVSGFAVNKIENVISLRPETSRLADYSYISKLIDVLAGRSLTLIDATITERVQREALKDTLRGIVKEQREKAYNEVYQGK
jgi:hypothetical protein